MSARMHAYIPHAFVSDALRMGWCWSANQSPTHHCEWSLVMWRCDCRPYVFLTPLGMSRAATIWVPIDGVDMPADAGCWGGSAP